MALRSASPASHSGAHLSRTSTERTAGAAGTKQTIVYGSTQHVSTLLLLAGPSITLSAELDFSYLELLLTS